jgi:hypothetical protein
MYLQKLMAMKGYIEGKYNPGIWDAKSKDGLREVFLDGADGNYTFGELLGVTPQQLKSGDMAGLGGGGAQPSRSVSNSTSTSTSRSVNLSTASGARAVLTGALQTELGREPTAHEVQSFLRGLNRAEQRNASTSTSTSSSHDVSTSDGKGHSQSTGTSTSNSESVSHNFSPEVMAQRFARQNNKQEFKQYQDAGYYDVIAGMLGM